MARKTVDEILAKKVNGEKVTMLTAYDYPTARLVDACGVDIILVGDSLANVMLGLDSTREVGMEEMIHHAKAVNRAVENALLVGDLPYEALQGDLERVVEQARRFIEEAGCAAVKVEWFDNCILVVEALLEAGIAVMGHVGLTPQTAQEFKVQGKDAASARRIVDQARAIEETGCFSIVLECIPDKVARIITGNLKIPTIGIGAGPSCDGQVLVFHDLVGMFDRYRPKFVKQYVDAGELIKQGIRQFCQDVADGKFPDQAHSYTLPDEELRGLRD